MTAPGATRSGLTIDDFIWSSCSSAPHAAGRNVLDPEGGAASARLPPAIAKSGRNAYSFPPIAKWNGIPRNAIRTKARMLDTIAATMASPTRGDESG